MFGYVTVAASELSEAARKRYRACYCGLCHTLRQRYGQAERMTLSYDMTFLLVLLDSLYEPEELTGEERCAPHMLRRHEYVISENSDYCADMCIALSYHKLLDDSHDEGRALSRTEARLLQRAYDRVRARYPAKCREIERCLDETAELEKAGGDDLDELANLTGRMLGAIYRGEREDEWASTLERMGAALGRFIYMMDAYDDLPADLRKGRFNPLKPYRAREDYESFVKQSLTLLIAECTEAFEELPLVKDMDILRNILYAGCWSRYMQLQAKRDRKKGKLEPKEDGA